jgi:hypothetical protein
VLGLGLVGGEVGGVHVVGEAGEGFRKGFEVEDEGAGIFEEGGRRCRGKESCGWCRCLLLSLIDRRKEVVGSG